MTVVDPSHPKAQPGFSADGTDEELPGYAASSSSAAITEPLFESQSTSSAAAGPSSRRYEPVASISAGFTPAAGPLEPGYVADLNPEMRKKLQDEIRGGYQVEDFGLGAEEPRAELPTFEDTDREDRPVYQIDSSGNIVSHDPKLNSNPAALLRFLRLHSASPPSFSVHLRGSHVETRTETYWETKNGRQHQHQRQVRDEVEDFSFSISADQCVQDGFGSARGGGGAIRGVLYPVPGWEMAHRGGAWATREVMKKEQSEGAIRLEDAEEGRSLGGEMKHKWQQGRWRHAGMLTRRRLGNEKAERERRGLPLFVHPKSLINMDDDTRTGDQRLHHPALLYKSHFVDLFEGHSSVPLNLTSVGSAPLPLAYDALAEEREARDSEVFQIVEDYCRCNHKLKELTIEKELYGWNLKHLEAGLRSIISRQYGGTVQIAFRITPTTITCRPDNFLSRIFSLNIFYKLLLWLCLVYPALLLFECFAGQRWNNLRCAFPLTRWRRIPIPAQQTDEPTPQQMLDIAAQLSARRPPRISQLPGPTIDVPTGPWVYLVGTQEGEWVKKWELAIVTGVNLGRRNVALDEDDLLQAERERQDSLAAMRGYSE